MKQRFGRSYILGGLTLILPLAIALPVHALTMDEAVDLALKNNNRLQEYRFRTRAQEHRVGAAWSPFLPRLDADYQFTKSDDYNTTFQTEEASTLTASASYNLFRGMSDLFSLLGSKAQLSSARHEQKAVEGDVALEARTAFIEVLRASRNLTAAQEAVELLERQRRDAELQYRVGLTAKNEFLKVEVELASARQGLIRAEGALRVARKTLERAIGMPAGIDVVIEELVPPIASDLNEAELSERMLRNRSELASLRSLRDSRNYAKKALWSGYLPSIDVSAQRLWFGDSLSPDGRETLADRDTRYILTATWNFFDGFKTSRDAAAARADVLSLDRRILDTEQALLLQLRSAVEDYRVSAQGVQVADKAVAQAEENYRITNNQFRERIASSTDLLDARVLLTRARTDHSNALYDLHRAAAAVERIIEAPLPRSLEQDSRPHDGTMTAPTPAPSDSAKPED